MKLLIALMALALVALAVTLVVVKIHSEEDKSRQMERDRWKSMCDNGVMYCANN